MGFWWLNEEAAREFLADPDETPFAATDLHPDLLAGLTNDDNLYHPLCEQEPFHNPIAANKTYRWKLDECCDARLSRKWPKMFMHIEKRWKLEIFERLSDEFDDAGYWKKLGELYAAAELFHSKQDLVNSLLSSPRGQRENLMKMEERDFLASLPHNFTVYRGFAFDNASGWSWTLDKNKAIWFANRPSGNPKRNPRVSSGTVTKTDVVAFLAGRNEQEIVVDPRFVRDIETTPVA